MTVDGTDTDEVDIFDLQRDTVYTFSVSALTIKGGGVLPALETVTIKTLQEESKLIFICDCIILILCTNKRQKIIFPVM